MGIKNDWLERQIEAIGQGLAAVLFGKKRIKDISERLKDEENQKSENQKMNEMLLDVLIKQYLEKKEFSEAEKILFLSMEKGKTLHTFMAAMSFYNQLGNLDDEELKEGRFSKERINQGVEKLKEVYENF